MILTVFYANQAVCVSLYKILSCSQGVDYSFDFLLIFLVVDPKENALFQSLDFSDDFLWVSSVSYILFLQPLELEIHASLLFVLQNLFGPLRQLLRQASFFLLAFPCISDSLVSEHVAGGPRALGSLQTDSVVHSYIISLYFYKAPQLIKRCKL